MVIYIYLKLTLERIAQPFITNIEDFEKNPTLFYLDWDSETMVYSEIEILNPKLEKGILVEKTRLELINEGIESLSNNEMLVDGKIIEVELKPFEKIINNEITYDREGRQEEIKKELEKLKTEYSEKTFIFKEKYLQKNRELDKNNLGNIVTFMTVSKQTHFKDWKFKDLEDNDVYVDLTLHDMLEIALIMQEQTTKAMKIETTLNEKAKILLDEELKEFDSEKEFDLMWNSDIPN